MIKIGDVLELDNDRYIVKKEDNEYFLLLEGSGCVTATGNYDTLYSLYDSMADFVGHYVIIGCIVGRKCNVNLIKAENADIDLNYARMKEEEL